MSQSFWNTLSSYCEELAPVVGPLLGCVAETADAIDRAGTQPKSRRALKSAAVQSRLSPEDE